MKDSLVFSIAAVAGLALSAANWLLANSSPDITAILPDESQPVLVSSAQTDELLLKSVNLVQARTRPLFEKSRRPWLPNEPQTMAQLPDPAGVQVEVPLPESTPVLEPVDAKLIGIQRSPALTLVLIADSPGTAAEWFKAGSAYKEWKIGEVTADSVVLENAGQKFKLELYPPLPTVTAAP